MYEFGYIVGYVVVTLLFAAPPVALLAWAFRKRPAIMYRNAPRQMRRQWNNITAIDPVGPLVWNHEFGRYE